MSLLVSGGEEGVGHKAAYVIICSLPLIFIPCRLERSHARSMENGRSVAVMSVSRTCSNSRTFGVELSLTSVGRTQLNQMSGRSMLFLPSFVRRCLVVSSDVSRRRWSSMSQISFSSFWGVEGGGFGFCLFWFPTSVQPLLLLFGFFAVSA